MSNETDTCTGRILVAEDNSVNQIIARATLNKLGYETDIVANGRAAIEAIAHTAYDLVLMDCQMPVLDGYEATKAIRATGNQIPILALTASDRVADRERSLALLDTRSDDPVLQANNRAFLSHGTYEQLATLTVHTGERTPEAVAAEVLDRIRRAD